MRTESLLTQSQSLAEELTSQQEELRETNTRLEKQAATLQASEELLKRAAGRAEAGQRGAGDEGRPAHARRRPQVEGKNREIELAKLALQEKAEQLALTSKYKSEFLANMSHELRTPLNSLLILSEMLADNPEGNLTRQAGASSPRRSTRSGSDLLSLINDILDMAKIESGTMAIEVGDVRFARPPRLRRADLPARWPRPRGWRFDVELAADLPAADRHRLEAAPAGAAEPALQRLQVHRARARSACGSSRPTAGWSHRPPGRSAAPGRSSPSR